MIQATHITDFVQLSKDTKTLNILKEKYIHKEQCQEKLQIKKLENVKILKIIF